MYFTPQHYIEATFTLKKRNLCVLPSGISSHPEIVHSSCVEFQGRPSNKKRRKSSRLLSLNDAYDIRKHYGIIFPIETRMY